MAALEQRGLITAEALAPLNEVARRFAVSITPAVLEAIAEAGQPDGIARQYVPAVAELAQCDDERPDPIGDQHFSPLPGIVHRYPDRALLKPLHVCPVYCRFCFRREVVGPGSQALTEAELDAALGYIRDHPQIWEVILTGGDPLMLSPRRLGAIMDRLDGIDHVGVVRLHTRVPVADPERVDETAITALKRRTPVWVAIHVNHPDELTTAARRACAALADAGLPLLSQSVLLKGVNDDAAVLTRLFRALVALRIKPYYLHHPDLARGTGHFRPEIADGQALVAALRGRVSGLCQPTYVLDIPGGFGKVPIGQCYLETAEDGSHTVTDPDGGSHRYPRQV